LQYEVCEMSEEFGPELNTGVWRDGVSRSKRMSGRGCTDTPGNNRYTATLTLKPKENARNNCYINRYM